MPTPEIPFDPGDYVDTLSAVLDLPIPAELRPGVIDNIERIWVIAQPVLDFPLPDDLEVAPTFEP